VWWEAVTVATKVSNADPTSSRQVVSDYTFDYTYPAVFSYIWPFVLCLRWT
jgi:hypothetical protein